MTYERKNLSGEFFTTGNKRLIIKQDTKIDIQKIRTPDEIKKLEESNNTKISEFKSSDKYKKDFDDIILEAVKRGIDPEFAVLAFSEKVKDLAIMDITRPVIIEEMFTEFDRKRGQVSSAFKNKKQAVEISLLKEFTTDWRNKAKEFGIKEEVIKEVSNLSNSVIDFKKLS